MKDPALALGKSSAAALLLTLCSQAHAAELRTTVTLDKLIYHYGDEVTVSVDGMAGENRATPVQVRLISENTGDIELLTLRPMNGGGWRSERGVKIAETPSTKMNGVLSLAPGETFFAFLFHANGKERPRAAFDFGLTVAPMGADIQIDSHLQRLVTSSRNAPHMLVGDSGVVALAGRQLVLHPRSADELTRFMRLTRARIVQGLNARGEQVPGSLLVELPSAAEYREHLGTLRSFLKDTQELHASDEEARETYAECLYFLLEGFQVAVNPALQWHDSFQTHDGSVGSTDFLEPGSSVLSSLPGMQEAWMYAWLFDFDQTQIPIAIIDQGFAPNYDFRGNTANSIWQCNFADFSPNDPAACGPGGANGRAAAAPTVGNSFFGNRTWHGTGVTSTALGTLNNGWGTAGAAGQVGRPMLYRMDFEAYAFQIGDAIRHAANDGAAIVNISAGYPCRILQTVSFPYEICNAAGRAAAVADLIARASSLAAAACGPFAPICAIIAAYEAREFDNLLLDVGTTDLRESIEDAVAYANARGVVVVASAGNKPASSFALCAFTLCGNINADHWQIIPCVVQGVICVGAAEANATTQYRNAHFRGPSVAIWAPIRSTYWGPPSNDVLGTPAQQISAIIGGTSAAAPVISGVVALIEASNPALNPSNAALTSDERAAIPARIRALIVGHARTFANGIDEVKLVDPYASVREASASLFPDPAAIGESGWSRDDELPASDSSDNCSTDDSVKFGLDKKLIGGTTDLASCAGTLITVPAAPGQTNGVTTRADVDVVYWKAPLGKRFKPIIELTMPTRTKFGFVGLDGQAGTLVGTNGSSTLETYRYETLPKFGDSTVSLTVKGIQLSDNAYRIRVDPGADLGSLSPDRFDYSDEYIPYRHFVNDVESFAAVLAVDWYNAPPQDYWKSAEGGRVLEPGILNFHVPGDQDWFELRDVKPDPASECGSLFTVSADLDVKVEIFNLRGELIASGMPIANYFMQPGSRLPGAGRGIDSYALYSSDTVKVRFTSASDAAIEYEPKFSIVSMSPVACQLKKRHWWAQGVIRPLTDYLMPISLDDWGTAIGSPTASRPVTTFMATPQQGSLFTIRGLLVSGTQLDVELYGESGRRLASQHVAARELAAQEGGGYAFTLRTRSGVEGPVYVVLSNYGAGTVVEFADREQKLELSGAKSQGF